MLGAIQWQPVPVELGEHEHGIPHGAGAMTHWPALEKWQHPKYLLAVAGRRTVPVELGKHYLAEGWGQSLTTVEGFVRQHVLKEGPLLRS